MPVHDWTRVDAGIFHAFHLGWIDELARALNLGLLPEDYYALPEKRDNHSEPPECNRARNGLLVAEPRMEVTAETDMEFYRRKQNAIAIRHVSGDRVVAMIEIVSPGNKASRNAMSSFVEKAAELLDRRIHLLIADLLPPGPRDPQGIHGAIWEDIAGQEYVLPPNKPLTLAAYETALTVRAFVRHIAIGDSLPEMSLFLEPNGCVQVPMESTYQAAFAAMPRRWRDVLER